MAARDRPPPGLRGRDIGLWYAHRNRNRKSHDKSYDNKKSNDNKSLNRPYGKNVELEESSLTALAMGSVDVHWLMDRLDYLRDMRDWKSIESEGSCVFAQKYNRHLASNIASSARLSSLDDDNETDSAVNEPFVKKTRKNDLIKNKDVRKDVLKFTLGPSGDSDDKVFFEEEENALSAHLKQRHANMTDNKGYKRLLQFRRQLPAYKMRDEIVDTIQKHDVVVISGDTGCGKTTQVPQFILDSCLSSGRNCRVLCTQPRRISAISVAERVAEERGENIGGRDSSVGYQIRLESKLPSHNTGTLVYCTTGVVLQFLRSQPDLDDVTHIVMDEVHERDLLADLLITIIKLLRKRRPSLKLVLMSATINADEFAKYFDDCPILSIPGRVFNVAEYYLEDVLERTQFDFGLKKQNRKEPVWLKHTRGAKQRQAEAKSAFEEEIMPYVRKLKVEGRYCRKTLDNLAKPWSEETNCNLIVELVHFIHTECGEGAILVFVDGWELISSVNKGLSRKFNSSEVVVYPLHSLMPTATQKGIFEKPSNGVRKIIVATNIAETSITVDDVVYVVDSGKIKMTNFDPDTNAKTLLSQWVSLANAKQRKGRAGRCREGMCFHLYSKAREMKLESYMLPEILRTRLDELILQVKILELGDFRHFLSQVMSPPDPKNVEATVRMLEAIDALTPEGELTPLGYHLAHLPMDAQMGKMILFGAIFCCLDPILSIAAALSFKDPFVVPLDMEEQVDERRKMLSNETRSDHLMVANLMHAYKEAQQEGRRATSEFVYENFLQENTLKMIERLKKQFAEHLYKAGFLHSTSFSDPRVNTNAFNGAVVKAVIAAGLYPNLAKLDLLQLARNAAKKGGRGNAPSKKPLKVSTENEKSVGLHRKSVNCKEHGFTNPWLVFFEKIRMQSGVSIFDCTEASSLALILFGEHLKLKELNPAQKNKLEIHIDNFVRFQCSKETARVLRKLRLELEQFLSYKITHPGGSKWNEDTKEGYLLSTLVQFFDIETYNGLY